MNFDHKILDKFVWPENKQHIPYIYIYIYIGYDGGYPSNGLRGQCWVQPTPWLLYQCILVARPSLLANYVPINVERCLVSLKQTGSMVLVMMCYTMIIALVWILPWWNRWASKILWSAMYGNQSMYTMITILEIMLWLPCHLCQNSKSIYCPTNILWIF